MSTSHTPGPWRVSKHATPDYAPQFGIYSENYSANDLAVTLNDNAEANAALIAAAPALLNALEIAEATLQRLAPNGSRATQGTRDVIRAAIAQAKGLRP